MVLRAATKDETVPCPLTLIIAAARDRGRPTLPEFFGDCAAALFVTFEEGTWTARLYDLLKPRITKVLVCNPRKIPLVKQGNTQAEVLFFA